MEVLAVPIPFQALVNGLVRIALLERLTDPQASRRRMAAPSFFIEPADPAPTGIVITISPEHAMHLVDQVRCISQVFFVTRPPEQFDKVADRECISPKVSLRTLLGRR